MTDPTRTDLLRDLTGHPTVYWLSRVETLIRQGEREPTTEEADHLEAQGFSRDHKFSNLGANVWMHALALEIKRCAPTRPHDGNMWLAAAVGAVLTAWYLRLLRVKSMDEARPIGDRMPAYERYLEHVAGLWVAVLDERDDALTFPHITKRINPFSPDATSGGFR